jgi:hypothetical protein
MTLYPPLSSPISATCPPQEVKAPIFRECRYMDVIWFSVLRTGSLYPRNICAIVWQERLSQLKLPVRPLGIKPATFRFVAQCLNKLRHRVIPPHPHPRPQRKIRHIQ